MFASWLQYTVVVYFSGAILGYLSGGSQKMGYAMGAGLIIAPIVGFIWALKNR